MKHFYEIYQRAFLRSTEDLMRPSPVILMFLNFEISANRFLRNMVRAVVGTLIEVGRGRMSIAKMRSVVYEGTRCDAGESMPANGLFLWEVEY